MSTKCQRAGIVAGGTTFAICGKPTTWLVSLNDKAWPLCDVHREVLRRQYAEHPRYTEQEITDG